MTRAKKCSLLLGWVLALHCTICAQPQLPTAEARISLLTVAPGQELYSAFGHSAFRIADPARGIDYVYNYGTFDFNTPDFYTQFALGKLPYMLSISYTQHNLQAAEAEGRMVLEQELDLTPTQKQQLIQFLHTNYLPQNRYYPYDFFMDNCATRLRDALEQVLADSMQWHPRPATHSYRQLIDPYLAAQPFTDFGIDLLLGVPTDAAADHRQVMFLPDSLQQAVARAYMRYGKNWRPLVKRTVVLYEAPAQQAARGYGPLYLVGVLLVAGVALAYWARQGRLLPHNLWFDRLLLMVVGLVGCIMFFETCIAAHAATKWNLNLLWAWPTHLVAAFALRKPWMRRYALLAFGSTVLAVLLAALGVQAFHPAALLLAALLALRWFVRYRALVA